MRFYHLFICHETLFAVILIELFDANQHQALYTFQQRRSYVMSVESHIKSLQTKHAELEALLSEEMTRPNADFFKIKAIKKQKLVLKEEIMQLLHDMDSKEQHAS